MQLLLKFIIKMFVFINSKLERKNIFRLMETSNGRELFFLTVEIIRCDLN